MTALLGSLFGLLLLLLDFEVVGGWLVDFGVDGREIGGTRGGSLEFEEEGGAPLIGTAGRLRPVLGLGLW